MPSFEQFVFYSTWVVAAMYIIMLLPIGKMHELTLKIFYHEIHFMKKLTIVQAYTFVLLVILIVNLFYHQYYFTDVSEEKKGTSAYQMQEVRKIRNMWIYFFAIFLTFATLVTGNFVNKRDKCEHQLREQKKLTAAGVPLGGKPGKPGKEGKVKGGPTHEKYH